jgi:hypothetical protein
MSSKGEEAWPELNENNVKLEATKAIRRWSPDLGHRVKLRIRQETII